MRIAFLIQDLCAQGAQYVTVLLARGFAEKGYEVDLLLSQFHGDFLKKGMHSFPVPKSVNVILLKNRRARNNIRSLRSYIKSTDASVIVAMSNGYAIALAIASFGCKRCPRLVFVDHLPTGVDFNTATPIKPSFRTLVSNIVFRMTLHRMSSVFCVSEGTALGCIKMYGCRRSKIKIVYNPVDINDVTMRRRVKARCSWLIKKECPTFVAAGAYNHIKNHLMLFKAIKEANTYRRIRLVLFGGDTKDCLEADYRRFICENGLEDNILLAGFTDNLPVELRYADGFVCSSLVESFSVVIVEALAAGCPVISTDCPYGPREILEGGKFGILVKNNDSHELASALLKVASGEGIVPPTESWKRYETERIVARYEDGMDFDVVRR